MYFEGGVATRNTFFGFFRWRGAAFILHPCVLGGTRRSPLFLSSLHGVPCSGSISLLGVGDL